MTETVKEWLRKAEHDFATARRESVVKLDPNLEAVCFHAQQGLEKLMNAILMIRPTRTHDLVALSRKITAARPDWSWPTEDLRSITRTAIESRYPGEEPTSDAARELLATAERVRCALFALFPQGDLFDRDDR